MKMKISEIIRKIKEGEENIFYDNRRLSFYKNRIWLSTIASEKSVSESTLRKYLRESPEKLNIE